MPRYRGDLRRRSAVPPISWRGWAAALLLVASFLLGGTGGEVPFRAMILELLAVGVIALASVGRFRQESDGRALLAIAAVLALPLLQLIPLPPSIWMNLPGREIGVEIARIAGGAEWLPISLAPEKTLGSVLGLLPGLTLFALALRMTDREKLGLLAVVVALACISAVLGFLQIASGSEALYPFASAHEGLPIGLFTNRNHQAILLVIGATLSFTGVVQGLRIFDSASALRLPLSISATLAGACLVCTAGVIATYSRTGIVLLALALAVSAITLTRRKLLVAGALAMAVFLFASALWLAYPDTVLKLVERFFKSEVDSRYEFWPEVLFAISYYFPWGSGAGTFVSSYQATEQLSAVGRHFVNRAHNDYLEMAVEFGVFGMIGIALFLILFFGRVAMLARRQGRSMGTTISLLSAVLLLLYLLHSLVDYPVRTFAHMSLFGLLLGFLFAPMPKPGGRANGDMSSSTPEGDRP